MRVSLLAIAGGVGFTYAQGLGGVPSCAVPCVLQYTSGSSIAGCNNLDASCICANQSFISNIACCLVSVCSEADQQAATAYADQLCKANGVIVPTAVSCTSSIITSTTSTPSSTATAAGSTTSSSSGSASSQAATHTSSYSSSSTGSSTSSSTAGAATKNAGTQNVAGLGAGILGGLAAAAALL